MDQRLKERLTGAVVLILLAVIVIPLILDGPSEVDPRITTSNIPEKPDEKFTTRLIPIPEPDDILPVEEAAPDSPALAEADQANAVETPAPAEPAPAAAAGPAEAGTAQADAAEAGGAALTGWVVQVGSLTRKNADRLNDKLRAAGYRSYVADEPVKARDGALLYRVRIGPEAQRSKALKLKAELKKDMDLDGFVLNYP